MPKRSRRRIVAFVSLGVLLALGAASLSIYQASRYVPDFYEEAIQQDTVVQKQASDECLQQATALASDVGKRGRWQALFTAEQINGWLAVDLIENYPDLLPPEIKNPRVAIDPRRATIACQYDNGESPTVLSLTFDLYLVDPNVVAMRVHHARAGILPIPLAKALERITEAAAKLNIPLEWRQTDGDPVALITIPSPRDEHDDVIHLEAIELRDGEVYLAGHTDPAGTRPHSAEPPPQIKLPTAANLRDGRSVHLQPPVIGSLSKPALQR